MEQRMEQRVEKKQREEVIGGKGESERIRQRGREPEMERHDTDLIRWSLRSKKNSFQCTNTHSARLSYSARWKVLNCEINTFAYLSSLYKITVEPTTIRHPSNSQHCMALNSLKKNYCKIATF